MGKRPKQVSCGGFHTAVVTEDGKVMTFGGGEHGQLGHSDRWNKLKPTLVQALDAVTVSYITCGWSHSVALISDGTLYSWGKKNECLEIVICVHFTDFFSYRKVMVTTENWGMVLKRKFLLPEDSILFKP